MSKQLAKRIGILTVVSLLYSVNTKAQDDYLVGAYYYSWYHENSWFWRGLSVATDSLLHHEDYYRHFVVGQFNLLLNRDTLYYGEADYYVERMQTLGWRQDTVIRRIGELPEYFNVICNSQNSIFVDSISLDLMSTYKASLDSLYPWFLPWCVAQLDSGVSRGVIIDTLLHRAEQYKHFIDTTYWILLGRGSNTHGLAQYTNLMATKGWTKDSVIMSISSSPEFWYKYTGHTKEGFVDSIFMKLTGGPPTSAESSDFVAIIDSNYEYLRGALDLTQPPELGEYRSDSMDIIKQHIDWADEHGIDFFCCSWWGINSYADNNIKNVLCTANNIDSIKFCIFHESGPLFSKWGDNFDSSVVESLLLAHFKYIAQTYFNDSSYLRINNRPVVFLYNTNSFKGNYATVIAEMRDSILALTGDNIYLVGDVLEWLWEAPATHAGLINVFDAITCYSPFVSYCTTYIGYPEETAFFDSVEANYEVFRNYLSSQSKGFVPDVMPGYNDRATRLNNHILPRRSSPAAPDGTTLTKFFKIAKPYTDTTIGNMLMITSWNEWYEDTQIEPNSGAPSCNTPLKYTEDTSATGWVFRYTYENYGDSLLDRVYYAVNWFASDISEATGSNNQRKLAVDSDSNLHLVFSSAYNDIRYAMSSDGGVTWEKHKIVGEGKYPAIAIDPYGVNVNVCWVSSAGLHYRRKTMGEWGDEILLLQQINGLEFSPPSIAASSDTVCIAVQSVTPSGGQYQCYVTLLKVPITNPLNFTTTEIDSWTSATPYKEGFPSIVLGIFQHVTWVKNDTLWYWHPQAGGPYAIATSVDGGASMGLEFGISVFDFHVVYEKNGEIYYLRGAGSYYQDIYGEWYEYINWWAEQKVNDSPAVTSEHPVIDNTGSLVVWQEGQQIYWSQWFGYWQTPQDIDSMVDPAEYFPQIAIEQTASWSSNLHWICTVGDYAPYTIKHDIKKDVYISKTFRGIITQNTTWDTDVFITGDVTVDSGVTLTIEPGVSVYFMPQDDQRSGEDTTTPEVIVYGTLIADSADFIIAGKQYWKIDNMNVGRVTLTDCVIGHEADLGASGPQALHASSKIIPTTSALDVSEAVEVPKEFKFYANYPNPLLHSTIINYQLPVKSEVLLRTYDVTGRLVNTLVAGEKEAGDYKLSWDAKGLATGVYFMKFSASGGERDYKATKKLIIVR